MIIVRRRYDFDQYEAVLAYDAESGELWGYPEIWGSNIDKVGLTEHQFAQFFDGPNLVAFNEEQDPFEETPNAEDVLRNYPPGSEDIPDVPQAEPLDRDEGEGQEAEKAASSLAEAAVDAVRGSGTGNGNTAEKADSTLSKEEYERCDDFLREMHKNLAEWDGDDLAKAPPVWESDSTVPEFVKEVIRKVISGDIVWDKFAGYSSQAAQAIQNSLEENLTQPQGWSIKSLVNDLQELYPGMKQEQATNIARTETSAILNSARAEAYKERSDSADYLYYWQGPADSRRTKVCKEITQEVEKRGGSVPMETLQAIVREKARKYAGTREGGTPERADEWTPHYQCRHTFVRDVKSDL